MRPLTRSDLLGNRVRLVAEALEDRSLPAGNVTAFVSAGILNVVGDGESNRVLVAAVGENSFVVSSLDGTTTVNGSAQVLLGGVKAINAQMGAGNDLLHITGTSGALTVFAEMGEGNDGLALTLATHEGMTVLNTGPGDDVVSVGASKLEGLTIINVGTGNNQVYLAGVEFDDAAIGGQGGKNQLSLLDTEFDSSPLVFGFLPATATQPPLANDDSASVRGGDSVTVNVAANDLPVEGTLDASSVRISIGPSSGTARVNADGTITYTAAAGSTATTATFRYTIQNTAGGVSNEATVIISLLDSGGPVPTVTKTTAGTTTGASPFPVRVRFDENVTGFEASDVTVTNGTLSNFVRVNARTYTFNVTPTASGNVVVTVPAGAAENALGNPSTAASLTVVADLTAPGVTITATADPTNDNPITFTATFTEDVTGLELADIVVTNGTASNLNTSDPETFTFDVTPTGDGPVTVSIAAGVVTDLLGNANTAGSVTVVYDGTAPTAVVTPAANPTSANRITFTVTFDEDVTGLASSALGLVNGTLRTITQVDPRTFTVEVTPKADGDVTLTVLAGQAQDLAGNVTTTAYSGTTTSDQTAPTVAIVTASTAAVTGTASDATTSVTGVQVSIFDGSNYWSGTAFDSATEVFHDATSGDGFATWSYAIAATGTFTVVANATDAAGNVGTDTESVTVS